MTCNDANAFIEAVAVGEAVPDEVHRHVAGCRTCAARLALARRIEQALASQPEPAVPATFTLAVMARVRRERWRIEQAVDISFNLVVATGALLIVAGVAGLFWRAGVWDLGGDLGALGLEVARAAAARAVADAQIVTVGVLLLAMAVALWWWAEDTENVAL